MPEKPRVGPRLHHRHAIEQVELERVPVAPDRGSPQLSTDGALAGFEEARTRGGEFAAAGRSDAL